MYRIKINDVKGPSSVFCPCTLTYIALQLVRLLGMFDVELLGVAGVVVELVPVSEVTSLSLTLFGLQELGLVCMDFVVGALLLGLTCVLQVALEFAGCQRVYHLGVILDTAQPNLVALVLQMGLLIKELLERKDGICIQNNISLSLSFFFFLKITLD